MMQVTMKIEKMQMKKMSTGRSRSRRLTDVDDAFLDVFDGDFDGDFDRDFDPDVCEAALEVTRQL
jgi:hypothetical protein